jgi:hypothetical protein
MLRTALFVSLVLLAACGGESVPKGPGPALLVAQAQFTDGTRPDGSKGPVPGAARLVIVRLLPGDGGSARTVLEDPDSQVFHKAMPWEDGFLTIGATKAELKTWRREGDKWVGTVRWNPTFGGKFDRLRDVERGDVDRDGKDDLVIATHDQGVVAIVHPFDGWKVEEIDRRPNTFVHEIELGDVDGDGQLEIFATPSNPNKLDAEQKGEVAVYRRTTAGWERGVVDAPGDTHAKEILTADADGDGKAELYVVWEGTFGAGGALLRPVTISQYRWVNGSFMGAPVGTVPDRQMRALQAGDVTGDGKLDLVGTALTSGIWLFERQDDGAWKKSSIDAKSSGFEHPLHLADLDGDGKLEIYVAAEDQQELRRYRFRNGTWEKTVIAPLRKGDITWNITHATL